jgi:hypothetical protein
VPGGARGALCAAASFGAQRAPAAAAP